ncbi:MAG: enoyl-CoA hydratase/isomerase family protein [Bacteroidetes bacterium]|nr:enoyl-CoA hydratase/isomerase family protein [Bacteroidota bacterium]
MKYNNIITKQENNAFIITINRENKLNALNIETLQEIKHAVLSVQNNKEIRGIILTGKGNKAFAAGADIAEFKDFNDEQGTKMSIDGHSVMNTLENSKIPTIAAVNGFSLGGGNELAMSCHIRIASENAKFGQPEVNLGLPPGYGGTQRLVQLIGKGRALELLITADIINAQQALEYGLITKIVPIENLLEYCKELINKITEKSPSAVAKVIECVNKHFESTQSGFETENKEFGNSFGTSDFIEGTNAFNEKRKPKF